MLDMKYVREHTDEIRENIKRRRSDADVDKLISADEQRLVLLQGVEGARRLRNEVAESVQAADKEHRAELIEKGKRLKEVLTVKDLALNEAEMVSRDLLIRLPNLTHHETPDGDSDEDNKELRRSGEVRNLSFTPKSHAEITKRLDLVDFERGAKVSGAKYFFLKGKLAILEQALISYGLNLMYGEGFTPITTPDVAKEAVLIGKGFLPRGPEKQVYYIDGEDLALIGTSEITILGYHSNEVLSCDELPKKYVAFSHCFRTEAGSYGREEYGLYRVHQFSKVEMFAFTKPEQSEAIHLEFLRLEEMFWQSLGIPYRVVDCCAGDLSGSDYRRFDLEAWMWGKNNGKGGWGEVTSTSNCTDFQSRGMNIKYSTENGEREFVHTLNGTVVATPRALLAIIENFQQEDGTVIVPKVLVPYCGFDRLD